jgi:hypothetical protein
MSTRMTLRRLTAAGFALFLLASRGLPATAAPSSSDDRPGAPAAREPRSGADADLPSDGRPIVATVVDVDEDTGRVTLDTRHGRVDLSVSQDIAARLIPGDVVVLRLTDDDADSPAASPREAPPTPKAGGNRI